MVDVCIQHVPSNTGSKLNRLGADDVHFICSSQVITGIPSVLKELIENAIDAKATSVEVRLRDYGLKTVEVIDNGTGIAEEDLDTVCASRSTSKLKSFSDIDLVATFGFRGEALHSLCAVSKVEIVTRTAASENGWRIEFDLGGKLLAKKPFHREIGTTVIVSDLFNAMPVRRRELERNTKKHFANCLAILKSYAIISTGIRFVCTNTVVLGKVNKVFDVISTENFRSNICCVFSSQDVKDLVQFQQCEQISDEIAEEFGIKPNLLSRKDEVRISGLIAGVGSLTGDSNKSLRACADRQFIFLNSRPANLPKICRLFNDFFRPLTCRHVYPSFFLKIDLSQCRDLIDINVSPDKRDVFLACESLLLAILKSSLVAMMGQDSKAIFNAINEAPNEEELPKKSESEVGSSKSTRRGRPVANDEDTEFPLHPSAPPQKRAKLAADCTGRHLCLNVEVSVSAISSATESLGDLCCSTESAADVIAANISEDISASGVFNKSDFTNLVIIGQFNNCFIIAQLGDELYIIDQHAADERWNFELLEKAVDDVKIQSLIAPRRLQLPADAEVCLQDNLEIVEKNGFRFTTDGDGKLLLTGVPSIVGRGGQSCLFGQNDLEELIYLLTDESGPLSTSSSSFGNQQPSRLRRVHASRACRRAVMAGEPLSNAAMRKLLTQLSNCDHPWNCPHGRPTIRHLVHIGHLNKMPQLVV